MSKEIIRSSQFAKVDMMESEHDIDVSLNEEQLLELTELYEGFFSNCKPGNVVTGKVVEISSDGVLVDIGYKSDGMIPRYEFSSHELKEFKAGDEIEVMLNELESVEGDVELSYEKAKALKAWSSIMKLFEEDKPVEGIVTHKVKGGLSVDIGIPAFLPGSQVDVQRVTNFDQYVGQTVIANIIKVNQKRGNVIISRRKHLSEQRAEVRKLVLDTLSEGQMIEGIVKNITNYGVFIDIGGVDGLLHITDMTWGRISHPSEIVKIGDNLKVKVLSFDKENEKISLGTKQLSDNPWEQLTEGINAKSHIKGKVSSITDYGLFVEVQKGVEGLIHISEISWTSRINDLNKHYAVGDEVEAVVISLDKDNRRMSLSIKQLDKNPWEAVAQEFKVDERVKGTISNITDFGIFVQLKPGIDGLVHVSDLSWTEHIEHPNSIYRRDQEIDAIVLGVDIDNKKISLGIKQLTQDPWGTIEDEYKVGQLIDGEISKITNFGMFIRLASGIEGLVHISELNAEKKGDEKIEDLFKVGEKHQFRVIKVSKDERKLGLSTKLTGEMKEERKAAPKAVPAAKETSYKKESSYKKPTVEKKSTAKSQFQLELEKHAARNDDESGE
jgi:small subunit ribosomal protein S1